MYTYHITIEHHDGDVTVFDNQTEESMVQVVRMAVIDPTLVVRVQRDDVSDSKLAQIIEIKESVRVVTEAL